MYTSETGKKLVELCKQSKNLEAVDTLYSPEIVSVEPMVMEGFPVESHGIQAVRKKNISWFENQKINSFSVEGPFVNGDRFSVNFKTNATSKKDGKTRDMKEVGLYTVLNNKIIKEEFFSASE